MCNIFFFRRIPAYDSNNWFALFFFVFLVICMYIFLSILLAVVYTNYRKHLKVRSLSSPLLIFTFQPILIFTTFSICPLYNFCLFLFIFLFFSKSFPSTFSSFVLFLLRPLFYSFVSFFLSFCPSFFFSFFSFLFPFPFFTSFVMPFFHPYFFLSFYFSSRSFSLFTHFLQMFLFSQNEVRKSVYRKRRQLKLAFDIIREKIDRKWALSFDRWKVLLKELCPHYSQGKVSLLWHVLDRTNQDYIG